jgi:DNA helicase II / ATP-dependent DNA helicase PcrA
VTTPVAAATARLLADLNPAQRAAAQAVRGPVAILAGAGTGKTRTITYRIAIQVRLGVARPGQVLAVTFTERAAAELRHRLGGLGVPGPVRAATFHAAAWAQLRHFWPRLRSGPQPDVLASKLPLLAGAARRTGASARDLASEIEWAKARGLGPEEYAAACGAVPGREPPLEPAAVARIYGDYEREKHRRGLVDYDDMVLWVADLLDSDPDAAAEVRDRYRFLTVDEFQDVNPAQWRLLEAWLGESSEVCVVGDPEQTIYGFAGATAAYLLGFTRRFPAARVFALTHNYRSTAPILSLAASVLAPGRRARGATTALRARTPDGPRPTLRALPDADAEVAAVMAGVGGLLDRGVPAGEVAICYRLNSQSQPFEAALRDAGIPHVVRGDGGFATRPEIRQAITALAAAAAGAGRQWGPPPPGGARPARLRPDRDAERVLRQQLSWHPSREPRGDVARERWRNLALLTDLARRVAADDPELDLAGLVAALAARVGGAGGEAGVSLLTLHRSKGLEFDAVFAVGIEEGLVPITQARSAAAIAEERRLLYVGLTRARRYLWVSWAAERRGPTGRVSARRPSRFLAAALRAGERGRHG